MSGSETKRSVTFADLKVSGGSEAAAARNLRTAWSRRLLAPRWARRHSPSCDGLSFYFTARRFPKSKGSIGADYRRDRNKRRGFEEWRLTYMNQSLRLAAVANVVRKGMAVCIMRYHVIYRWAETCMRLEIFAGSPPVKSRRLNMVWTTPVVAEVCVGMEVTSYASAEI